MMEILIIETRDSSDRIEPRCALKLVPHVKCAQFNAHGGIESRRTLCSFSTSKLSLHNTCM